MVALKWFGRRDSLRLTDCGHDGLTILVNGERTCFQCGATRSPNPEGTND